MAAAAKSRTDETPTETRTALGSVLGLENSGVHVFKGIPYAASIDGLRRWLPPQAPPKVPEAIDARAFGPTCPQPKLAGPRWLLGEAGAAYLQILEDTEPQGAGCLNLNVWTPSLDPAAALPVMVWIHGGGLTVGSSRFPETDGAALARKGVVVVSLNYRLGAFGFLAGEGLFPGELCIGNRGFMDQIAALTWVRDHIRAFGGDPKAVTLFGQSAGGTSVATLLASPRSEGLFERAIIQSGPLLDAPAEDCAAFTRDVLRAIGLPILNARALAGLPDHKLLGALTHGLLLRRGQPYGALSRTRMPFVAARGTAFLPRGVLAALAIGAARGIDVMVGTTRDEARASAVAVPGPEAFSVSLVNRVIAGLIGSDRRSRSELRKRYRALMPGAAARRIEERVQTDALFRIRLIRAAERHSAAGGRTYMYRFDWRSPAFKGVYGAIHALDVPFVFDNLDRAPHLIGDLSAAQPLADAMSDAWVNFARTGVPGSPLLPAWPRYDAVERKTMIFDRRCRVASDPDGATRAIWDELGPLV